jgi:acyl-CoA thioesterase YciA
MPENTQRPTQETPEPSGEPALRTIAMPADTNPNGDIFGGWLLAQMDIAGSVVAYERAKGRVATIAIDAMTFMQPVFVGDLVSCYATLEKEGRTSMRIKVDTYARRRGGGDLAQVTQGSVTYVAIDENRRPRPLPDLNEAP